MDLSQNIIGFHHVSIKAENFETTIDFYKKLGFEEVHNWSLPDFNLEKCSMLYNKNINYYIEVCDKNADIPAQGRKRKENDEYIENALLHICFVVKDAGEARKQALQIGAKDLSKEVFELDLNNSQKTVKVRNSLVYSPNGEVIEFLEKVNFDEIHSSARLAASQLYSIACGNVLFCEKRKPLAHNIISSIAKITNDAGQQPVSH